MGCSCKTVTTGILLLVFGVALAVLVGVYWWQFLTVPFVISQNVDPRSDVARLIVLYYFSGWIVVAMIIALIMVVVCGIIGVISGCQRGQCINLSYLVMSVMTCVMYVFLLIASSVILSNYCADGFDKCYSSSISFDQRNRNIVILCTIILTFLIMVVSFIGSCISCRARCYCCGASPKSPANVNEQDNFAMVEIPITPAAGTTHRINEPSAPPQAFFFP